MLVPTNLTLILLSWSSLTRSWVWKFAESAAEWVTDAPLASFCVHLMLVSEISTVLPLGICPASSACWNWPKDGFSVLDRAHCSNTRRPRTSTAIRIHGDTRGRGAPGPPDPNPGPGRREPGSLLSGMASIF